jgi:small subunit ribosomal protein S1
MDEEQRDENLQDEAGDGEENFAELLEQSLGRNVQLEPGQKIEATVLQVGDEWIFLDVGQKGEGVLETKELLDADNRPTVAVGDSVAVYFLSRRGGELRFTTRLGGGAGGSAQLEEAWRSGIPVEGRIEKEIKGGYEIRLPGNVRAFCPFSQLGLRRIESSEEVLGRSLPFKISRFAEQGRNIVVSHREILEEERRRQREVLKQTLREGMIVTGTVTSIRDFGAFVDIGGAEGLLPISEAAWGRVEDLHELLSVGQQLELAVKSIDWERGRLSFSLRETRADPWTTVDARYREGTTVTGTVARLAPFGAFVTLEEGVDGLLHISRLGEGRQLKHPREILKTGQQLEVTIEKIDQEQRRISLLPASTAGEEGPGSYVEKAADEGLGTLGDLLKAAERKKGRR